MNKQFIDDVCENLYKDSVKQIPQVEDGKIIWFMNGSTVCNILYNVVEIDGVSVSKEFNNACYSFVRVPKGDIDITYVADRPYIFDLSSVAISEFQNISEEKRTYNFVDSNSEMDEQDLNQLCFMKTKNGFSFYVKQPQYLFLYKFKEFLALFHDEILLGDVDAIGLKKKNVISDVKNLYAIANEYCGEVEIFKSLKKLPDISDYMNTLSSDRDKYVTLIEKAFSLIDVDVSRSMRYK